MRLALISGGSRGLGAALCAHYVALGYEVVEFSRSAPHPYSVRLDLADPRAMAPTLDAALQPLAARAWDEIVAIGNAAVLGPIGPASRQAAADIAAHVDTNVTSGILFLARIAAAFRAHGGRKVMINVSSGAATKGYDGWSLYCASKAALENFVRAMAAEQAREPHPFRVASFSPGVIDTDMQAGIRAAAPEDFPDVGRFVGLKDNGALRPPAVVAAALARVAALPALEGGRTYSVNDFLSA